MGPLLHFWAKLGREIWPEKYHPVVCHLIDVAAVAQCLWQEAFRLPFRQWLAARLGLEEPDCARWVAFWAGAHDIGKVAPCFQDRNDARTKILREALLADGFAFPVWDEPHGTISTAILFEQRAAPPDWPQPDPRLAQRIAVAVGGHHGLFPCDWAEIGDLLRVPSQPSPWTGAQRGVLRMLAAFLEPPAKAPQPTLSDDQAVFMALAGLTSVADWIGSNQTFFEPAGNRDVADGHFDIDGYCKHARKQARDALHQLGWLEREPLGKQRSFQELFAAVLAGAPRPLQEVAESIALHMAAPSLVLIEAPMGEGKTEAAWYVADAWDRRGGQGTYVALPTMATSNQMFDRVRKFLEANDGKKNFMLLHGKAVLNEQFEKLKYAALLYDDANNNPSAVVAEQWFAANKKHGLLAPFGVGTIDQALMAVLQTKHVFVRLFGLAGKCVILDEVHAYDAYMTTLMERLLRWLAALGCPIVLLSATLPREKRIKLIDAYAPGAARKGAEATYPRITTVQGAEFEEKHVEPDKDRARTVHLGWLNEKALAQRLRGSLADGGCAVVIRNTVGSAQETYLELRDTLREDGITVELFHARFPFGRRMEIENAALQRFGKESGQAERNQRVLVATQVVEQSLDLDFDLMVSDVAPIDLALQRAGRLHRHDRGQRPAGVALPWLWLIEPPSKDGLPDFKRYDKIYARFILLRSYIALNAAQSVRLPDDLERFVEQVYGTEPLTIPDGWQAALNQAEQQSTDEKRNQRMKAKNLMIRCPDAEDLLSQQNAQLDEDNPEAAEKIRAATRETEPTIQVILVYRIDGDDYLDSAGRDPFREADEPDIGRTRRLLENEVTINHRGCMAFYAAQSVPRGWREKGMLRHHRVIRVDQKGRSLPGAFVLRVDRELGLMFKED